MLEKSEPQGTATTAAVVESGTDASIDTFELSPEEDKRLLRKIDMW